MGLDGASYTFATSAVNVTGIQSFATRDIEVVANINQMSDWKDFTAITDAFGVAISLLKS